MKSIYIECHMGCAGDMLLAGLVGVMEEPEQFMKKLNSIGLPDIAVELEQTKKCQIRGNSIHVRIKGVEEEQVICNKPVFTTNHTQLLGCKLTKDIRQWNVDGIKVVKEHEHSHEDEHKHSHKHEHSDNHDHEHNHSHEDEHKHSHEHEHSHNHDHEHNHNHEHFHGSNEGSSHSHADLHAVNNILKALKISGVVRRNAMEVYTLLAEAEASVHGTTISQIHFHEVGTMDAVADIVGVCLAMEELGYPEINCSPIHVGSGMVLCAHGELPVPAPATAKLLQGIPFYSGEIKGELCTPTGAALLKHFVKEFKAMPLMTTVKIGYGMGKKDFEQANCLRVFLSENVQEPMGAIVRLSCNIDDMTGEELGFAMECLMQEGALDAFLIPVQMKKNRPGFVVVCLCQKEKEGFFTDLLYQCTTTLGIRKESISRTILERETIKQTTPYGEVRVKVSKGASVFRYKIEYEDLKRIAKEQGKSLLQIKKEIQNYITLAGQEGENEK